MILSVGSEDVTALCVKCALRSTCMYDVRNLSYLDLFSVAQCYHAPVQPPCEPILLTIIKLVEKLNFETFKKFEIEKVALEYLGPLDSRGNKTIKNKFKDK